MGTEGSQAELNNTSILILLLTRISVLLFSILLVLKTDRWPGLHRDIILLGCGIYHVLAACMYWPVMRVNITRLLLCACDMLIATIVVLTTGGMSSSFLPLIFIPVFTLHFVYGWKGLAAGLGGLLLATISCLWLADGFLNLYRPNQVNKTDIIIFAISMFLFYILPFMFFFQYSLMDNQLRNLKNKYNELDTMNSKLLVLYEMTGRFNYENGTAHIMDKLLTLCREIFPAKSVCVFLIRNGEVEIYGNPSVQEKEEIYRLIMEQKKNSALKEESEYILREDALVIPLIRGARTDGVLSFNGWEQREITGREAILLSMMANMVCTYLENLEYVDSLKSKLLPDSIVVMNQLDSGKPVKGIIDRRIINGGVK